MSETSNRRSEPDDPEAGTTGIITTDHEFVLSDYEAANLAQALVFLNDVGGNTGDWHGQLIHRLLQLEIQTPPNKSAQEQRRALALKIGWNLCGF